MKKFIRNWLLGSQQALAMFGATTLVGILTGIPITMTLFTAGVGTLLFHLVTGGKVPVFLGSSFAFLAPFAVIAPLIGGMPNVERLPYALGGVVAAGGVYLLFAFLFKFFGKDRIMKLFPPVVTGTMIILIGLILAPTAVSMASENWFLATVAIVVAGISFVWGKGMIKILPILIGVAVSYVVAVVFGQVGSEAFSGSAFALPHFMLPKFELNAIIIFAIAALVTILEHIGDISAIGAITKKNYFDNPGLHRTLIGDGLATSLAGFLGGPANTTYSECTGTMVITGEKNPATMRRAAVIAILLSFVPFMDFILGTIPVAIIGGICFLLYGTISTVGIKHIIENKVNFESPKNIFIVALMLIAGLGFEQNPIIIQFASTSIQLGGLAMSALIGVSTNAILMRKEKE